MIVVNCRPAHGRAARGSSRAATALCPMTAMSFALTATRYRPRSRPASVIGSDFATSRFPFRRTTAASSHDRGANDHAGAGGQVARQKAAQKL